MILQIDDFYFNPDQVIEICQVDNNVRMFFNSADGESNYYNFVNWKVEDLAAEINIHLEAFQRKIMEDALLKTFSPPPRDYHDPS